MYWQTSAKAEPSQAKSHKLGLRLSILSRPVPSCPVPSPAAELIYSLNQKSDFIHIINQQFTDLFFKSFFHLYVEAERLEVIEQMN